MSGLDAASARRRFLVLRALRWLPTGLLIPVLALLMIDRGLSLGQIGMVMAAQGVLVLALELPTGGLADAIGRRPVLLLASVVDVASLLLLSVATTMPLLAAVAAMQGIYRSLESGPQDAWYVDAALTADPDADIEGGLAAGGAVLSIAIAMGALLSGALVALAPVSAVDPLVLPLLVAAALRVVDIVMIARLMTEVRPATGAGALRRSLRQVPTVVAEATRIIRASRALLALIAVEILWGFGMTTFETLLPPRLAEVVGGTESAGALMGPAATAAWIASAAGAAAIPLVVRRFGATPAAIGMRLAQGATVAGMGLAAGPVGVLVAYLATYSIHGAANPVHQGLLHRQVGPEHRTTVLSANSMMAHPGAAVGGIALGALADATSISIAMFAGAAVLAAAAPLYVVGRDPRAPRVGKAGSGHGQAVSDRV